MEHRAFTAYIAEPIDQGGTSIFNEASRIEGILVDHGLNVYRPASAWHCGGDLSPVIEMVNREALAAADIVVAYLPKGTASIGVPIEIAAASQNKAQVIVVTQVKSFALAGLDGVTTIPTVDDLPGVLTALLKHMADERQAIANIPSQRLYALPVGFPPSGPQTGFLDTGWPVRTAPTIPAELLREAPYTGEPPAGWTGLADSRIPLIYQKTSDHAADLRPGHDDDAGLDLTTTEDALVPSGQMVKIPLGIRVRIPEGTFGWVVARSSTWEKYGLMILPGVMDVGYRGPWYALALYLGSNKAVHIPAGTRLCQMVLLPNVTAGYRPVEGLVPIDTSRGEGGFGSTDWRNRLHIAGCTLDRDHPQDCVVGPLDLGGEKSSPAPVCTPQHPCSDDC